MLTYTMSERASSENVRTVSSCCTGEVIPLERLSNDVFSSMILGDGFGVIPSGGHFVSPSAGVVKDVSASGCDVTIKTDDGLLLIVSIGRQKAGEWLMTECRVCPGDRVEHSSVLWELEPEHYIKRGNPVIAVVIVTNSTGSQAFNIKYGKLRNIDQPVMKIKI